MQTAQQAKLEMAGRLMEFADTFNAGGEDTETSLRIKSEARRWALEAKREKTEAGDA